MASGNRCAEQRRKLYLHNHKVSWVYPDLQQKMVKLFPDLERINPLYEDVTRYKT